MYSWQQREEQRQKPQRPPFDGKTSPTPEAPDAVRRDMERMERYRQKLQEETKGESAL